MAAIQGANQSPRVTTNYLNQIGRVGDPAPGVPVSTAQASGSIVQPYGGMMGGKLTLSPADASSLSDPTVRQLSGGVYMYVQFRPDAVSVNAAGNLVFWSNLTNYIVTPDGTGAAAALGGVAMCAGACLNATKPGNYDFIQVAGEAWVKFGGTLANGTPAVGDLVIVGTAANPTLADDPDPTAVTSAEIKLLLGRATRNAPAANAVSRVLLGLTPTAWIY